MIVLRSHIAYPSAKHLDDPAAHGLAFDADEIAATKTLMGLPPDETFYVPDDVLAFYREAGARGHDTRVAWESALPGVLGDQGDQWDASLAGKPLGGWADALPTFEAGEKVATRSSMAKALSAVEAGVPGLVAGGADLTGNTGTQLKGTEDLSVTNRAGRQIRFGIREHGMGSSMNGMAMHGGLLPVGGTFLVFSDYMRPSVRLAAIMGAKVIYSWSHDSVGVGEDGPTHQPIEQVMSLRAIPDLPVVRPGDANECVAALRCAIEGDGPVAMILSRQNLPVLEHTSADGVARGGYVLREVDGAPVTLVATGSEVWVALAAADQLTEAGTPARVVSLPCWEWFEAQSAEYRATVLGSVPRVGVEAGVTLGWHRWVDEVVGIDRFGASAPGDVVLTKLGINPEHVVAVATDLLSKGT
jgi:transketolase